MPSVAAFDTPTVAKIQTEHPLWTPAAAQHEAVVRATTRVDEDHLDRDLAISLDSTAIRDAGARMTSKKRETWKRNALEPIRQQRKSTAKTNPLRKELAMKERELRNL